MNRNFKLAMYFIITIVIIGLVAAAFIAILPYVILAAVVIWGIFKIRGYFNKNKYKKNNENYSEAYTYRSSNDEESRYESDEASKYESNDDDFDTSKAIDVDYEEVDKDKK
ncbi:hypothetical protein K5V21_14160 [Clostridium sardiniense]|uniref:Uncharacterized protein n=1 Tax=Clostridium sardiniense TaxID=29369 RepID=A0ABS7L0N9_CLOSR|nr:hypothetical protein [Clostridium sardiniense]MBY0756589.1 hypothetical protein [Clostridium sardiniense]MDQ0460338.1 hypothetical protein [Clostridium sardiniense]